MDDTNPYAPPQAAVQDVLDPAAALSQADRATRLGAYILDSIIGGAMVYIPMVAGMVFAGAVESGPATISDEIPLFVGLGVAAIGFIVWAWFTYVNVKRSGQTIAKKMLEIKVVRSDGSSATVGRIFWLRNVVNLLLSLIPFYGIIDALFIFGEARQCLHDKIADTVVVKA